MTSSVLSQFSITATTHSLSYAIYEGKMKPIPSFEFVLEDSPVCHQSIKYWNQKSKEVSIF